METFARLRAARHMQKDEDDETGARWARLKEESEAEARGNKIERRAKDAKEASLRRLTARRSLNPTCGKGDEPKHPLEGEERDRSDNHWTNRGSNDEREETSGAVSSSRGYSGEDHETYRSTGAASSSEPKAADKAPKGRGRGARARGRGYK